VSNDIFEVDVLELDPLEPGISHLSLVEVCERCAISVETVIALVDHGVVEPQIEVSFSHWQFSLPTYLRLRRALRLKRDLEINDPGVALVLELMDEMEQLRAELNQLRKNYFP